MPRTPVNSVRLTALAVALLVVIDEREVMAQQPVEIAAARDAYDRGAASYDAGEYALAAQQLAKADQLAPNDVALELALKASVKANDALLAMDLASRVDGRPNASAKVQAARDDARLKMANKVGKVTVRCAPRATKCSATLDDAPFPINESRFVLTGEHRVVIDDGTPTKQAFRVRVDPGAVLPVESAPAAPPPPIGATSSSTPRSTETPSASGSSDGLSPAWFWVGAGVSAVLGGVTIASAIDTANKHDTFRTQPSAALSDAGVDAQLRTNLLVASTAAVVVTTGVLGLFFVKWGSSSERRSARGAK